MIGSFRWKLQLGEFLKNIPYKKSFLIERNPLEL
eukprot:UN20235